MDKATFKTIDEILTQSADVVKHPIEVPNYQRGYKWSVKYGNGNSEEPSAIEKLLANLYESYNNRNEYFLQGITVQETEHTTIIIDGQQRLTSVYLLLWYLGGSKVIQDIDIQYEVREKSNNFLKKLKGKNWHTNKDEFLPNDDDEQDIFFFKQALRQIDRFYVDERPLDNADDWINYIKRQIKVLYITIDSPEKAVRTFTMMNGMKANMLDEELVKAEMLRRVSLPARKTMETDISLGFGLDLLQNIIAEEWETSTLRGRYAREWDRWMYWWNKKDVRDFFNVNTPMGLLLEYYYRLCVTDNSRFNFDAFKRKCLHVENDGQRKHNTEAIFDGLKHLQKSFEDLYHDAIVYNWLGLSMKCDENNQKFEIINYFIENKGYNKKLENYAKCKMAGATHLEITSDDENNQNALIRRQKNLKEHLKLPVVYGSYNDECYKFLMYLNIVEDNKLKRKFDFTIWNNKSLEHVHPKSRVYHLGEDELLYRGDDARCTEQEETEIDGNKGGWLARKDIERLTANKLTEHCIGNLVLLYGNNNSTFGAKPFEEKKATFFNVSDISFNSRNLLHTISKFAKSKWGAEEIIEYYNEIINQLDNLYENR